MKVLLHICCGICAASVVERLMCEGHKVTGFFYNPNIHPRDEYKKRFEAAEAVAHKLEIELIEAHYEREKWFELVKGKEYTEEGGERCESCFKMRLEKTCEYLRKNMFDSFTTTLTVSPLKNALCINAIGRSIGDEKFISADFKKRGGFERSNELAREWHLYRQNYCGCVYSLERSLKVEKTETGVEIQKKEPSNQKPEYGNQNT